MEEILAQLQVTTEEEALAKLQALKADAEKLQQVWTVTLVMAGDKPLGVQFPPGGIPAPWLDGLKDALLDTLLFLRNQK